MSHFNQELAQLAEQLRTSKDYHNKAVTSANYLINRIYEHFNTRIESTCIFGSFVRGTHINPKLLVGSDIDILVIFNEKDGYSANTYRNQLKNFANHYYKASIVANSCPATVLNLQHIRFDITPAIQVKNWFFDDELFIPDGYGEWQKIDSVINERKLTFVTSKYGKRVLDVTRILKFWNACQGKPFKPFEIEKQVLPLDYSGETLETAFRHAVERLAYTAKNKKYHSIQRLQRNIDLILSLPALDKRKQTTQLLFSMLVS